MMRIASRPPSSFLLAPTRGRTLYIENRELYTSYRLYLRNGKMLWHDVRNCYPLPPHAPQIIYARTIPWFMWIIYGIRDLGRRLSEWWEFEKLEHREAKKRKAIREYQKRVLEQQYLSKSTRYKR